ncbi:tetratricopeptide repeat protein [Streptomyces yangpuensis]|uniref:tetratricopeptide repeat protein n=1 Tax=Streptomyces yangpuensis TaxID=1648182 RepID=UPI000A71B5B1|nr:tetratricopeptide repeat protein [Streptomyces yangpuensis]
MLPELEGLIAGLEQLAGADRRLLVQARMIRAWVLIDEGRPAEAEVEAEAALRTLTRITHLNNDWELEVGALVCLGDVLCALGRHEEAEVIVRGHRLRAEGHAATGLHFLLLHSLSGQGRHEEALAESGKHCPTVSPYDAGAYELARAVALHGLGRHDEARDEAQRALTASERHLHPSHPRVGEIRVLLALIAPA